MRTRVPQVQIFDLGGSKNVHSHVLTFSTYARCVRPCPIDLGGSKNMRSYVLTFSTYARAAGGDL